MPPSAVPKKATTDAKFRRVPRAERPDRRPVVLRDSKENQTRAIPGPGALAVGPAIARPQISLLRRLHQHLSTFFQAIFVFVGGKLPPTARLLATLWHESADEDGFLYGEPPGVRSHLILFDILISVPAIRCGL
jgi:hypothetical protein